MAVGLIPVVGGIDGITDWVSDQNAFLFDLSEQLSLESAIKKIIENKTDFASILESNHKKTKKDGRFDDNIMQTLEIIERRINEFGK